MQKLKIYQLDADQPLPDNQFLDRVSDIALLCASEGRRLTFLNSTATGFFGWTTEEVAPFEPWWETLITADTRDSLLAIFQTQQLEQFTEPIILRGLNSAGSSFPFVVHTVFLRAQECLLLGTCPLTSDSAGEILRQTQARFRSIVDSLSINLILKDVQGRRLYANRAYLALRGFELSDVLGKTDRDLFPADMVARFEADDQYVIATGKVIHKFEENLNRDGSLSWTEVIKGPLIDADGKITGVQILFWDATEKKETEQALERERYLLHALLDNAPDSIYFKDRESRFLRISRGMAQKFHLNDPDEAIGKTDADIFTSEHALQAREDEIEIMETGSPMVSQVERETWPNAADTWSSTTKLPLRDALGNIVGTFGISRDITELIATENLLREASDAADKANKAKSEFLANMSHEIRTPMNGIIGMAELLRNTSLDESQQSFLEMIDQSAHSLLRIINDILDFSKIEAGKLEFEKAPVDLRQCVSLAAKSLAVRAAEKHLELILEIAPEIPETLMGDAVRLRQVLVNLVGNAIKFTEKGEIKVRVTLVDSPPASQFYTLHFSVSDTGIGIPEQHQSKIFAAFAQADLSTTRQYGGTGLGLSISSQIVAMMNGNIWLESEPGVGSIFHFTAQFDTPPTDVSPQPAALPEDFKPLTNAALGAGRQVLIVDDNDANRRILKEGLERRGFKVSDAQNAQQALEKFLSLFCADNSETDRGLLIVDQMMPGISGLELIRQLRELESRKSPITILLSTATDLPSPAAIEDLQIDAVLPKPALQTEILNAFRSVLSPQPAVLPSRSETPDSEEAKPISLRLRLLIAEDGEVNRAVLSGLLQTAGHEVTCVEDGQAAVEAWRQSDFDAIFMDLQMPILDGIEATKQIRQAEMDTGKHITIIATTAAAMESDSQRCLEAGMDDYLSKPFDFARLNEILQSLQSGIPSVAKQAKTMSHMRKAEASSGADAKPSINFNAPLARLRCSPEQLRQLVITLRQETTQRLQELTNAIESQDDRLLIRASHSLRSAAALFDAEQVTKAAGKVENLARSGQSTDAATQFIQLRIAATGLIQEIDLWLKQTT